MEMNELKIKPQSTCKRFTLKELGKNEYWSPNLFKGNNPYEYGKKIETMDMETSFIEEEFQPDIKPESDSYLRHDEDLDDLKNYLKKRRKEERTEIRGF
jgi:hypothetical protein